MRATGIVRRLDNMNKITIPKSMPQYLCFEPGDKVGLAVDSKTNSLLIYHRTEANRSYGFTEVVDEIRTVTVPEALMVACYFKAGMPLELFYDDSNLIYRQYECGEELLVEEVRAIDRPENVDLTVASVIKTLQDNDKNGTWDELGEHFTARELYEILVSTMEDYLSTEATWIFYDTLATVLSMNMDMYKNR